MRAERRGKSCCPIDSFDSVDFLDSVDSLARSWVGSWSEVSEHGNP